MHEFLRRVQHALMNIEINDGESWSFDHEPYGALVRFRWRCWLHDTTTDMPHSVAPQEGRWWYIDQNADEAHIVRSAWLAYKTFMMHEMLERFRYRGDLVFNPHFNI